MDSYIADNEQNKTNKTNHYSVLFREQPAEDTLCIFSSYTFGAEISEYIFYYLQQLKFCGVSIAFVSTSPLDNTTVKRISQYAFLVIERENKCPDFGSWKIALDELEMGKGFNSVMLVNDSVFGPLYDLRPIIKTMRDRYDVWGMTGNNEIEYHIQSYFLFIGRKVLLSDQWANFWSSIDFNLPKQEVIRKYEIGFSRLFLQAGYRVGSYADVDVLSKSYANGERLFNPTLRFWKLLIEKFEFPFLKREMLIRQDIDKLYWAKGVYLNIGNWRKLLSEKTSYPVHLIDNFMKEYYHSIKDINRDLVLEKRKVIFLAHNLEIGGAQRVLLNFLKWFAKNTNTSFEIISCLGGKTSMLDEFQKLGNVTPFYALSDLQKFELRERLTGENISLIFSNTMVNGEVMKFLSFLDVPQVVFVHELSYVLNFFPSVTSNVEWFRNNVSHFICCAEAVRENIIKFLQVDRSNTSVVYEFVEEDFPAVKYEKVRAIREDLKLPANAFVVGMCGTFEWRKSADLLPVIASGVCRADNNIHVVWVGVDKETPLYKDVYSELTKAGLTKRVHLVPQTKEASRYINLFDVFVMASREDPFPVVNIESGLLGKPTICFEGSGGSPEYAAMGCGVAVPYLDITELSRRIFHFYENKAELEIARKTIPGIVKENFTTNVQAPKIHEILRMFYDDNELILINRPAVSYMTHIYYDNSWDEIKAKLKPFDNGRNYFFFSISEACLTREKIVNDIKSSFRNSYCLVTSNIGKDIGGKLALIDIYLLLKIKSSYIVFLHDKQSPQTMVGEAWKNNLYKIVEPLMTKEIIRQFNDPGIGIIGAHEHIINEYDGATGNFRHNNELSKRLLGAYKVTPKSFEYLSGTMYWLRASIIEDFFSLHNPIEIREKLEAGNVLDNHEGTFAHTWERMFCWIASSKGYQLRGI